MKTVRIKPLRDLAPWASITTYDAPRELPERFKSVAEHRVRAVFMERWIMRNDGDEILLAAYTYAECRCGDRYVIRQQGPLVKDDVGWNASDEMIDAKRHFRRIYPHRLRRAYRPERDKVTVIS